MFVEGADLSGHSFNGVCVQCPGMRGGPGPCDHRVISIKLVRFVKRHLEEFEAVWRDPGAGHSTNLRERLAREYATLPPRHSDGSCPGECPREQCTFTQAECARRKHWHSPCPECKRIRDDQRFLHHDVGVEIGRTAHVHAPMPDIMMLDLAMAESMGLLTPKDISRGLSGRQK